MKKENILVLVLIGLAFIGVWSYFNSSSSDSGGNHAAQLSQSGSAGSESGEASSAGSGIDFQSYSTGMALAASLKRPVFLYFYADW